MLFFSNPTSTTQSRENFADVVYCTYSSDSVVLIEMPQDQNGNELEATTSSNTSSTTTADQTQQVCGMTEKQNRINRNLAKFLSTEKQQQQLLLCLRQQQLPQQQQIRLGALTSMTVACNFFYFIIPVYIKSIGAS